MNVSVPARESTQSFKISIKPRSLVECNEIFNVRIKSVSSCGVTIGSNNTAEVTITDNNSK